jgi:hypothetical protein
MLDSSPLPFTIVRIRPDTIPKAGLSNSRLAQLAEELSGRNPAPHHPNDLLETIQFAAVSPSQRDVDAAAAVLSEQLSNSRSVIIDIRYDTSSTRPGQIDIFLAAVFDTARRWVMPDHHIAVLVGRPLAHVDDLAKKLLSAEFEGTLVVVDEDGGQFGQAQWELSDRFRELVKWTKSDYLDHLRSHVLRCRGVFSLPYRPDERVAFRYLPIGADDALRALIEHSLRSLSRTAVVYEGWVDGWLNDVVKAACLASTTLTASLDDLYNINDVGPEVDAEVANIRSLLSEHLASPGGSILLIVPLLRSGQTAVEAIQRLRQHFDGPVSVLTVFIDQRWIGTNDVAKPLSLAGGENVPVDYYLAVSQVTLPASDWRVRAAEAGGMVEEMRTPWTRPSLVGLWSLVAELGCAVEEPTPPGRAPIRWFPVLSRVNEMDALWLAECLLRCVHVELGVPRTNVVIVMPDEESGSRPIARALAEKLDVAVRLIPRSVIQGTGTLPGHLQDAMSRSGGRKAVIADESAVTYRTINRLHELSATWLNQTPHLAVVALELTNGRVSRPSFLRSLYGWRPAVFESVK